MLIVVAMIALISSVPIVVLSTAVSQLSLTNENLYWNAAYEAAEAGLNDYTQQLDASSGFAQWVNTNSSFSCTYSPPALPTDPAGDAAFCGWVPVGSTSSNPPEWYEYSLPSLAQGALTLTVSGKAGSGVHAVVRTFTYNVVPTSSFLDNIYWSNYEMSEPTLNPACASSLGIPSGTSMSLYGSYASYFESTGPSAVWSGTAAVRRPRPSRSPRPPGWSKAERSMTPPVRSRTVRRSPVLQPRLSRCPTGQQGTRRLTP
jgi:hypothetical protein